MRLEQFQYLVEISRYKSMSKAAKKLFITQPSLSTSVQNLEEELGYQIFKRSSHGVSLTPQGEQLIEIAEVIVKQVERVKEISTKQDILSGDIHLVAAPVVCNALIVDLMCRLKKSYPNINLNVSELRPKKTIQAIVKGPATIGIGTYSANNKEDITKEALKNDLVIEELYEDEMYVFLDRAHPLLEKQCIFLEDLEPYTQAFFIDHDVMTNLEITSEKKPSSDNYFSFTDRESIKKIVAQGYAYAILPRLMAVDDIYTNSGLIKAKPIIDFDATLTTYMVYSAKNQPTLTEQRTIDAIRAIYTEMKEKYPLSERTCPNSNMNNRRVHY